MHSGFEASSLGTRRAGSEKLPQEQKEQSSSLEARQVGSDESAATSVSAADAGKGSEIQTEARQKAGLVNPGEVTRTAKVLLYLPESPSPSLPQELHVPLAECICWPCILSNIQECELIIMHTQY